MPSQTHGALITAPVAPARPILTTSPNGQPTRPAYRRITFRSASGTGCPGTHTSASRTAGLRAIIRRVPRRERLVMAPVRKRPNRYFYAASGVVVDIRYCAVSAWASADGSRLGWRSRAGGAVLEALESTQQEGPYRTRCVGCLPWPCRPRRRRRSLNAAGPAAWTIRRDVSGGTRRCKGRPSLRCPHSEALRAAVKSESPGARVAGSASWLVSTPALSPPRGHGGQIGGQRAQAPADSARLTQSVSAGDDEKPPVRPRPGQGTSAEIASGRRGRRFKSGHPDQVTGHTAHSGPARDRC
jgi:hypothetical protein